MFYNDNYAAETPFFVACFPSALSEISLMRRTCFNICVPRERTYHFSAVVPFRLLPAGKNSLHGSHQVQLRSTLHGKTVTALPEHASNHYAFPAVSAFPELPFVLTGSGTREEIRKNWFIRLRSFPSSPDPDQETASEVRYVSSRAAISAFISLTARST
jgi:hypothetical protein